MAERRYYTDNNWQEARGDDAAPRIQLADGRWIDATEVLQGDVFAKGETERAFQDRMFGGGSPNIAQGAATYMQDQGLTPQQYQQQTQSLPIGFNADGTTTLDMGQRQNTLRYENPDDGNFFSKYLGPALLGGAFAGGITGMLPGTPGMFSGMSNPFSGMSNPFSGLFGGEGMSDSALANFFGENGIMGTSSEGVIPGLDAINSFDSGAMAEILGTNNLGASAGGLDYMNSFDDGSMGQILGPHPTGQMGSALSMPPVPMNGGNGGSGGNGQQARTPAEYLSQLLGGAMSPAGLNLLGGGLGAALGAYGANQQANSSEKLYDKFIGLGAPYRDQLNTLSQNPDSFYKSPVFQGALQQGSDAMARSLSAKVGNPILNPTALQEMQNYTTRGSLDAYNNQFRNLMSAGQIGLGQSAQLGTNAANAQGGMADALGYGLSSVFNNRRDPYEQMAEAMRSRSPIGQSYLGGY
jgi:hypothetical protein